MIKQKIILTLILVLMFTFTVLTSCEVNSGNKTKAEKFDKNSLLDKEGNFLFTEDATFYAEQVAKGNLSAVELVQAALDNIKRLNPKLNAITHIQEKDALKIAKEYDEKRGSMKVLPPFYGVPILLKDLGQKQQGQPSKCGSKLFLEYKAKGTSNFVQRLIDAGFIVVGRTNVPEFGFKNISDSQATGSVNSPLDLRRNPGGSSGGAAASLKSGIVPIVTASDGGGSIRIPSSFSGLIGLKPSRGRVPVGPGSYRGWQGASVEFLLTKSIRDTWRILKWLQTFQPESPFSVPLINKKELTDLDKKLKIAYTLKSPVGNPVSENAKKAVLFTVNKLKALGHTVEEAEPKVDGIKAMQTYFIVNSVETAVMFSKIEKAMQRKMTTDDMEIMSWAIYRSGLKISGTDYSQVLSYWDQLSAQTDKFFNNYDILLMPTTNGVAPLHNQFTLSKELKAKLKNIDSYDSTKQQELIWEMFETSLAYTPFTQQQNLTGEPAISLPIYYTKKEHLPIGTQFSARKGQEYLLLQLAKQLEDNGLIDTSIVKSIK